MELRSSPQHRRNHGFSSTSTFSFFGKGMVIVSSLLILISFTFFFQDFVAFFSRPLSLHGRLHDSSSSEKVTCDYSDGRWMWDKNHRVNSYTEDCPFNDPGFRCRQNGRRNSSYLNWRWQPHGCNLPRFSAKDMLEKSRNRKIIFAGDSIARNQWESLVCMLGKAMKNQSRNIYEQNGNPITKHKGYLSIVFAGYGLVVEYYRTPFLVVVDHPPPNSSSHIQRAIRLDTLHWWSSRWVDADVLVFNPGHWWSKEKTTQMGSYFQVGKLIKTTMDVREAFRRSLQTVKQWTVNNLNLEKSYVFFESQSPHHYRSGRWNDGGTCSAETGPATGADGFSPQPEPWINEIISSTATAMKASWGRKVQFVNITYLTDLRKDGHPSVHREQGTPADAPEDCSHWCLPGVPDTWNEILYAQLVSMGYGSSSSSRDNSIAFNVHKLKN